MFGATEKAIAGNELYFTGSDSFDTVNSRHACHAKLFKTREAAVAAIAPWNGVGHKFEVREISVEYKSAAGGESKYVDGVLVGHICG